MRPRSLVLAPLAAAASLALAAACAEPDGPTADLPPTSRVETMLFPAQLRHATDLLFVIDDSRSMADEQAVLAANAPAFIAVLQQLEGGLPDVHLGVVSADVGAPGVRGCSERGDDGHLLVAKACFGVGGRFLSDVSDGRGGRLRSYTGRLEERFACVAALGTEGCDVAMPLESMRRALEPGANPGFLRDDADLLVVIITDGDDRSSTHAPALVDVEEYVQFLRELKPSPAMVYVSGIIGVGCPGDSPPPDRLQAFLRSFPNRNTVTSICAPNWLDALRLLGAELLLAIGEPCLEHPLADRNPVLAGVQPECSLWAVRPSRRGERREQVLAACADRGGAAPCWELVTNEQACVDTPEQLSLHVVQDGNDPIGGAMHAQCVIE